MQNKKMPHDHGQNYDRVLEQMPDMSHFVDAASTFKQLGDGSRLRILWLLCHLEECVTNIAASVNMSDAAVSHHLRTLKQEKLITSRRAGKEVYYKLADSDKANLIHHMIDSLFELNCPSECE